jgi:restriction system-associated AAA family ATPase
MKLISVKILGDDFRSLAANKLYEFNYSFREDRLSTKIFAGLNGSGKSNFLELFSEIFYFLEIFHLNTVSDEEKRSKGFGFEIEYLLPVRGLLTVKHPINTDLHVRIVKPLGEYPEFSKKVIGQTSFIRQDDLTHLLLPKKVIAYTSGQNELLSNPYYKLKYHYFKAFEDKNKIEKDEEISENHRLFFLDYSANFSVFVANMLLAEEKKVQFLKNELRINELQSFRITLNTEELYRKVIPVSEQIEKNIKKLKLCSTTWTEKKVGSNNVLIMDYLINDATKESFAFHFYNAFNLFKTFYELEIFNLYLVDRKTRGLILQANKSLNISDEMPKADPSRLVFRIEKVIVSKYIEELKTAKNIYYKSMSDGEHQFNEVIGTVLMIQEDGCLFLMDEPDTHFNPLWRAKLIEMLNNVTAIRYDKNGKIDKVRKHEIIITTHSPFVISDSQNLDVYKFDKINGEVIYINPKIETYGTSVSLLLQEIFNRRVSISDLSNLDLEEIRDELKELKSPVEIKAKIEEAKDKLTDFGESIEKFDLYSMLRQIEKKLDDKQ